METPDLSVGREAFAARIGRARLRPSARLERFPPEASEALATARWWLDDPAARSRRWEDAYTAHLRAGRGDAGGRAGRGHDRPRVHIGRSGTPGGRTGGSS